MISAEVILFKRKIWRGISFGDLLQKKAGKTNNISTNVGMIFIDTSSVLRNFNFTPVARRFQGKHGKRKEDKNNSPGTIPKIHRLILATKIHKGTQRKKEYLNHLNEKLLEVQKPFLEKVFGRRRQKLAVDFGFSSALTAGKK
jgi:hypothetical protein